jgi:hypothetical protein
MDENTEQNALVHVWAWARQTILFAINLHHLNIPIPDDVQSHFNRDVQEAEQIALRLFEETEAEFPTTQIGDAILLYTKKVLSWCYECCCDTT